MPQLGVWVGLRGTGISVWEEPVISISGAKLRRLIPAGAVAAVVAFSYMAPLPSAASSTNNCGVKGYGDHDHGRVCPNRPFPGKGQGLETLLRSPRPPADTNPHSEPQHHS